MNEWLKSRQTYRDRENGQDWMNELLPQSTYRLIQAGFDAFQSSIYKHATHRHSITFNGPSHIRANHQGACSFDAYAL